MAEDGQALTLAQRSDGQYVRAGVYHSPAVATDGARSLRVCWRPRWTAPMRWAKHADNPVLTPSPEPFWDAGNVTGPCVLRVGDELRMYYGSRPRGIGMATASIDAPHVWTKHPQPVLAGGLPTAFDANGSNGPKVVPVTDTHWHMYYVGYHPSASVGGAMVHQVGLAESDDAGLTWRTQAQPIIPRGEPGDDDGFSTSSACVVRVGGQWYMWYTAIAQVPYLASIGLAMSDDGHVWQKRASPVLRFNPYLPAEAFVLARPHVLYEQGVFRMWYSTKGFGDGTNLGEYRICYAESVDGIHWERFADNPVVQPAAEGWDHTMVEYAEVLRDGDEHHMWYCGDGYGNIGYARGDAAARATVHMRTGNSPTPGAGWSNWTELREPTGSTIDAGAYMQLRVSLEGIDSGWSPRVEGLRVVAQV